MDLATGGIWALALGLLSVAVVWFVRTPKEAQADIESRVRDLETKVDNNARQLGSAQHALELQFATSNTRLTSKLDMLGEIIRELSMAVKDLTRRMDTHRVGD